MAKIGEYTVGEPIKIPVGEHIYTTPPLPAAKNILLSDLPKKDQFWKRQTDLPKEFYDWHQDVIEDAEYTVYEGRHLKSLSREDTDKVKFYQDREFLRIKEGIWFFSNGEPTYITGDHYFVLQWAQMFDCLNQIEPGSPYGAYMEFQRNYAYFLEIAEKDPVNSGGNVVKPKKTGITMFTILIMLGKSIRRRNKVFRMMSTKESVAKKINFDYLDYALERLPAIMTPEYRKNLGAVFFENIDSTTKRSGKKRTDIDFMNSSIQAVSTIVNGFDSGKNAMAWIDEQSKIIIDSHSLYELHDTTEPTVWQGPFMKCGFMLYTHYVSERNDKSYKEAREIYYNGMLRTIDPITGKTKSKLLNYAMFVQDGIFGATDKYGKADKEKIFGRINAEKAAFNTNAAGRKALQAYKRQNPMTLEDMWQVGAGEDSIFDILRLGRKLDELTELDSIGNYPYMDFNFRWTSQPHIDEIKGIYEFPGKVEVLRIPLQQRETAVFKWYRYDEWMDREWLQRNVNKLGKDKKGRLKPNPECPFFASCDPTQYSGAKDVVTGSKNALQVFLLPNGELDGIIGKKISNKRLMVEYLNRPDSPRDTLMHVIQTIFYFGCYILIECNAAWLATRLKEWGLGNFLIMVNAETNTLEPYREFADQKPYTSQKNNTNDTIGEYVLAGMNHYGPPDTDMDIDNIDFLDSISVIKDLMEIDPNDTRKFDAGVCNLIGQHGMNAYLGWRQKEAKKNTGQGNGLYKAMAVGMNR